MASAYGLLGRVSMDMLAVDLGSVPKASGGTVWSFGAETVSVDEVAACASTISYELLTG